MDIPAPFDAYRDVVRDEWIDHNQHMNMGYYLVVFDFATDAWMDFVGLDRRHRVERNITTFSLEAHVTYAREVGAGAPLRFTTRLIAFDAKRLHYIHHMYHAEQGYLAASNELMSLHVSRETRRSAPMHPGVLARLERIKTAHDRLPMPAEVGHVIGLASKPTTG